MLRISIISVFLLLGFQAFTQETFPSNGAPMEDHNLYVLKNATVHQDHQTVLTKADVWIQDGIITHVSQGSSIPSYAIVKDCKGRHIYASFIDLYSDYGLPSMKIKKQEGPQYERTEKGAYGWNEAIRPEIAAVEHFKQDKKEAEKLRSAGFGAVLTHQMDGIVRGTAALVSISDHPENKSVLKGEAGQFMAMDKGSSNQAYPSSRMGAIALLEQTMLDMDWYGKSGSSEEFNLSLEALAKNMELPQFMLTKEKNDILRADRIGDENGYQYIFIGSGNEYERAQDVRDAGGLVVLPLNFPETFDMSDPYLSKHVSLNKLRHWEQAPANPAYLSTLGVEIAFTSEKLKDIKSFLPAVRKTVVYGLTKEDALKALTIAPAKAIGMSGKLGEIRAGTIANVLVCDGDILEKGSRILENWVQGKAYNVSLHDETTLYGVYDLNLDGNKYSLTIKQNKGKEKVFLTPALGRDTSKVKVSLKEHERQVNMSFQIKDLGVYRLHGSLNRRLNIWSGTGESPSGKVVEWNCIRKGDTVGDRHQTEDESKDKVSVLKYPNNGYGWTNRPEVEHVVLRNATVWTNGPKGVMKDADVLISEGKVRGIGYNLNVEDFFKGQKKKPNVKTIEAYGKHITSGIIDEHSHIAITGGVNESGQASSAEVSIGNVVHPEDLDIYYQLAGGVTASQLLHGSANPIGGQSALIKLRWGLNAEEMKIKDAAGFIKFALGENVKQSNWGSTQKIRFPQTRMGVEQVYYDHFHRALEYYKDKRGPNMALGSRKGKKSAAPPSLRKDLELEALSEILFQKRFITCHSYIQSEINMLMHVADSMGFTVNTFTHILEGYKVADKMKAHGAGGSTFSDWWAYKYEVREATPYNAALMSEQGITVAINSDDAEMGRRLNQEAAKGVKYGGMSEEEAWKMVTLNPAKLLRLDHRMGSLEEGKDADVVIWSDNPLSIYAKAERTYVDGICYFDMESDIKKRKEISAERARLIQKIMKKGGSGKGAPVPEKKHRYHCDHEGE